MSRVNAPSNWIMLLKKKSATLSATTHSKIISNNMPCMRRTSKRIPSKRNFLSSDFSDLSVFVHLAMKIIILRKYFFFLRFLLFFFYHPMKFITLFVWCDVHFSCGSLSWKVIRRSSEDWRSFRHLMIFIDIHFYGKSFIDISSSLTATWLY